MSANERRRDAHLDPCSHFLELILFEGTTCERIARATGLGLEEIEAVVVFAIRGIVDGISENDAALVLRNIEAPDREDRCATDVPIGALVARVLPSNMTGPRHVLDRILRSIDNEDYN